MSQLIGARIFQGKELIYFLDTLDNEGRIRVKTDGRRRRMSYKFLMENSEPAEVTILIDYMENDGEIL